MAAAWRPSRLQQSMHASRNVARSTRTLNRKYPLSSVTVSVELEEEKQELGRWLSG